MSTFAFPEAVMVISIATRTTSLKSKDDWEVRLKRVLPQIENVLRSHRGFVSAEFRWSVQNDGQLSNITIWETAEDALRYVRDGGAATVDALDQMAVPPSQDFRATPRRYTYASPSFIVH